MPKFQLNIGLVLASGVMGPNFNLSIEAPDYIAALESAKGPLTLVLRETVSAAPAFDAPAPETTSPAATS